MCSFLVILLQNLFRLHVLSLIILSGLHAIDLTTEWYWHGQFPWVYSHKEKGWHFWHTGTDGNFYRWKDSNQTWYLYDQSKETWTTVEGVRSFNQNAENTSTSDSKSDSSGKSEYENWWDSYDKSDDTSKDNSSNSPVGSLSLNLQLNGITRNYLLYVPKSYDLISPSPLLFNFHGYGGTSNDHLLSANMRTLADQENFLLVYPQGSFDSFGAGHWNASLPGGENKSTADDTGFVRAMITSISKSYQVDEKRIYACGYSNGGMMSYFLGGSMSDKIAAIGSVSGTMLNGNPDPAHPVPMINIHGTSDSILTYYGGDGSTSTSDTLTYWANQNGANSSPQVTNLTSGNINVEKFVYSDSNGTVWVEHYKVENGGHVWFDLDLNGSDTNRLLWDFFKKHDLNGPVTSN
jgi:polyhydroxybutyrate depolymerase